MNVNELSIGNYIGFNNQLYKIIEISYKGWLHLAGTKGNKVQFTTDYIAEVIQPIPITKEILENNGFTIDKQYYCLYFEDKRILPLNIKGNITYPDGTKMRNDWHFLFHTETNSLIIEDDPLIRIQYVHQLQNLLKLIGNHKEIII